MSAAEPDPVDVRPGCQVVRSLVEVEREEAVGVSEGTEAAVGSCSEVTEVTEVTEVCGGDTVVPSLMFVETTVRRNTSIKIRSLKEELSSIFSTA